VHKKLQPCLLNNAQLKPVVIQLIWSKHPLPSDLEDRRLCKNSFSTRQVDLCRIPYKCFRSSKWLHSLEFSIEMPGQPFPSLLWSMRTVYFFFSLYFLMRKLNKTVSSLHAYFISILRNSLESTSFGFINFPRPYHNMSKVPSPCNQNFHTQLENSPAPK